MDSSDSDSDDGSYVAHEESESDDEIEEPAAPERARSAAELIAALEDAPDEEIRAMMREARPLRSHAGHLPELWPPRRQCALRVALCLAPSLLLSGSRILRKTNEEEQCAERLCSSGRVGHRLGVDGMHREERAASGGDEHVAACGYQSSVCCGRARCRVQHSNWEKGRAHGEATTSAA